MANIAPLPGPGARLKQSAVNDFNIVDILWPGITASDRRHIEYLRFLDHVISEVQTTSQFTSMPPSYCQNVVVHIIGHLRAHLDSPRDSVIRDISDETTSEVDIWPFVQTAIHLLLGLHVQRGDDFLRVTHIAAPMDDSHALIWPASVTLRTLVGGWSSHPLISPHTDLKQTAPNSARINATFTMACLVEQYGFRIYWTSNLAEHLSINWKFKIISIYEHKICLWNHVRSPGDSPGFPSSIHEEALDTLNLLFPFDDARTKSLLQK